MGIRSEIQDLIKSQKKMSDEAPAPSAAEIEIKTDFEIPKMAEPKIDPNLDDFTRMRLEKDLKELKRMIETHFQVRKKDEEELQGLKDRIEKRKLVREQQIAERAIREKKRQEEEKAERIRRRRFGLIVENNSMLITCLVKNFKKKLSNFTNGFHSSKKINTISK